MSARVPNIKGDSAVVLAGFRSFEGRQTCVSAEPRLLPFSGAGIRSVHFPLFGSALPSRFFPVHPRVRGWLRNWDGWPCFRFGSSPLAGDAPEFIYSILIHYWTDNRLIIINNTPPYGFYSSRVLVYTLAHIVGQNVVSIWLIWNAGKLRTLKIPGRTSDGGTLLFVVTPSGRRYWLQRLTVHRKRRDAVLGDW